MQKSKTIFFTIVIALTVGTFAFAADSKDQAKAAEPVARRIDVNVASEDQLKAILGISDESARKIIAGRPYSNKEQLKTKKIIDAESYNKISKLILALC